MIKVKKLVCMLICICMCGYIATSQNNIYAETATQQIGDINGDKEIDTIDALMTLQYASGKITFTSEQITAADVNLDGNVNTVDALMILQYASGKISDFLFTENAYEISSDLTYNFEDASLKDFDPIILNSDKNVSIITDGSTKKLQCNSTILTTEIPEYIVEVGDIRWVNYTSEVELSSNIDAGSAAMLFRLQDAQHFYMAELDYVANKIKLSKRVNATTTLLDTVDCALQSAMVYDLKIEIKGTVIKTYVNDVLKNNINDSTFKNGCIALRSVNAIHQFDNLKITSIKTRVAPSAIAISTTADYYVATTGDDSNNGSINAPFKTVQRAVDAVNFAKTINPKKDYKVLIRGGTYNITSPITLGNTGGASTGFKVIYAAYPGETPVISGGKELNGTWTKHSGNIYKMTGIADSFNQLFVNDNRAQRAHEPDTGGFEIKSIDQTTNSSSTEVSKLNLKWLTTSYDIPAEWGNLSRVELNTSAYWHYNRNAVASIDPVLNKITVVGRIGTPVSSGQLVLGQSYAYLENALPFVDTENEWYLDDENDTLYYQTAGETPTEKFYIPITEKLLDVTGVSGAPIKGVYFEGLTFAHSTWSLTANDRNGIQAGLYSNSKAITYTPPEAIKFSFVENCVIFGCTFKNMGETAIGFEIGSHYNNITGNLFDDIGGTGIWIDRNASFTGEGHVDYYEYANEADHCEGNEISDNKMKGVAQVDWGTSGITAYHAHGTKIIHNSIENSSNFGIMVGIYYTPIYSSVTRSHHTTVEWNDVYKTGTKSKQDIGAIYFYGPQPGSNISNNYIHNVGNPITTYSCGIELDNWANYIRVNDNHINTIMGTYGATYLIMGNFLGSKITNFTYNNCGTVGNNYYSAFNWGMHPELTDSFPSDVSIYGARNK